MSPYEDELAQIVADLNRAAQASRESVPEASEATLDPLLVQAARRGASDLVLIAGAPPAFRVHGVLAPFAGSPLTADDTRSLLSPLLSIAQHQELQKQRYADLCFTRPSIGRFRANVHYQRGTLAGSIRLLPEKIPSLESLHLPATLRRFAEARQGLILVTGPT